MIDGNSSSRPKLSWQMQPLQTWLGRAFGGRVVMRSTAVLFAIALTIGACGRLTCSQARHRSIEQLNAGVEAYSKNNKTLALTRLKAAVTADPTYSAAHYNLGKIYQEMSRWADAAAEFQQVISIEPNNAQATYDLGVVVHMQERVGEAEQYYKKALELDPQLAGAHLRIGMIAEARKQPKLADSEYRQAIGLNPHLAKAFSRLGLLYLKSDYLQLAIQVFEAGLAVNSEDAELHNGLGMAHQQLGMHSKAVTSFRRALELQPGLYDALYNLGMAYVAANELTEARQILKRFTQLANRKDAVNAEYVEAAREKLIELDGLPLTDPGSASLPAKVN